MKLKKKDWVLMIVIVFVAGAASLLHIMVGGDGAGSVTVKIGGKITGVYSLAEDKKIEINNGTNILQIRDGQADMIAADCPDKLCVHQKSISKNHESIICLPNKVVVEVDSSENSAFDAVSN